MPKKTAPIDTRNLTVEARRELFLKSREEDKPDFQVLTKDYVDELTPYGLITFDTVLGLGGIARRGCVSQIHGDEGVGKSTLTYTIAKNYQEYTGEPLGIFDFEGTGRPAYLERIGCDLDMVKLIQPISMEESVKETIRLIRQGCRFFIYDSIPCMNSMVEETDIMSGKVFKASYGKQAQVMGNFYRILRPYVQQADGHMFMVNQTRARIDDSNEAKYANDYSYTNKTYQLPGGRISRFTPSVMIEMRMVKEVKPYDGKPGITPDKDGFIVESATPETKDKPCVNRVRVRTLKNKVTGAGFREGFIWVRPATHPCPGIDDLMSVRELARHYGFIQNKGAKWFVGKTADEAIQAYPNKDAAIDDLVIKKNPEVHAKLKSLVAEAVRSDSTGRFNTTLTTEDLELLEGDDALAPVGVGKNIVSFDEEEN
jgi:RecA/RadA recombinase